MVNKVNIGRMRDAILASDNFNMCEHSTCFVGHAYRLGASDMNSRALCEFVGVDPDDTDQREALFAPDTLAPRQLSAITKDEAVTMLEHLADTSEIKWPWE